MLDLICTSIIVVALSAIAYGTYERFRHGLSHVPGSGWASVSNLPRFFAMRRHAIHRWYIESHNKYGDVVRVGPRHVSFASMEALQTIHGSREAFGKSAFYNGASPPLYNGVAALDLFQMRDIEHHAELKRVISVLYTKIAARKFEPLLDECILIMVDKFNKQVQSGPSTFDMSKWLHFYAFDSLCAINISERFGFLDQGTDIDGVLRLSDDLIFQFGLYAQLPLVNKMLLWLSTCTRPSTNPLFEYTVKHLEQRLKQPDLSPNDMLGAFLALRHSTPDQLSLAEIAGAVYINILAGHDVLAITLRSIFYHLSRDSSSQDRLRAEIKSLDADYPLSHTVPNDIVSKLPYLEAVVLESLRVHANTGTLLERIVPPEGRAIDGYWIPGGTVVGCNAWVVHRNKRIFGEDVEVFRPERWIEAGDEEGSRMRRGIFSFGAGPRMCIGKNIAMMQIHKVVVELIRRYRFEPADPRREWHVVGGWITKQLEMDMVVTEL